MRSKYNSSHDENGRRSNCAGVCRGPVPR